MGYDLVTDLGIRHYGMAAAAAVHTLGAACAGQSRVRGEISMPVVDCTIPVNSFGKQVPTEHVRVSRLYTAAFHLDSFTLSQFSHSGLWQPEKENPW